MRHKQQPEALAEFAESARHDNDTGKPEVATSHTQPKPEPNRIKHDAATRVLNEGATGRDKGADEAVARTQDRIKESR